MTLNALLQFILFWAVTGLLAMPLGFTLARIFSGAPSGLDLILGPFERGIYRLAGVRPEVEQNWSAYAAALLTFNSLAAPCCLQF